MSCLLHCIWSFCSVPNGARKNLIADFEIFRFAKHLLAWIRHFQNFLFKISISICWKMSKIALPRTTFCASIKIPWMTKIGLDLNDLTSNLCFWKSFGSINQWGQNHQARVGLFRSMPQFLNISSFIIKLLLLLTKTSGETVNYKSGIAFESKLQNSFFIARPATNSRWA